MVNKTKIIKKNDDLARTINLIIHKNKCCRCNRSGDAYKLDWSHVFGRQTKCIRWDERNALAMCFVCHKWWHENPLDSAEWFEEKYPGVKSILHRKLNAARPMKLKDYLEINQKLTERLDYLKKNIRP